MDNKRTVFDGTCSLPIDAEIYQAKFNMRIPDDLKVPLPSLFRVPILINEKIPDGMFMIISNGKMIKVVLEEITKEMWMSKVHDNEDF